MLIVFYNKYNSKPILNCSTIDAYLFNVTLDKNGEKHFYSGTKCIVNWFNNVVGWIQIENEFFDNFLIPDELLLQITKFMSDKNNYETCNHNH